MLVDLPHHLAEGAGVGIQLVHLGQSQVIEAQQFHGGRIAGLHAGGDVVHDVGNAHQAALELPAVHGRCHPGLRPEVQPHQRPGQ
ncbi:hypothetical protein D3C81_1945620 [compost metagenome]